MPPTAAIDCRKAFPFDPLGDQEFRRCFWHEVARMATVHLVTGVGFWALNKSEAHRGARVELAGPNYRIMIHRAITDERLETSKTLSA